MKTVVFEPLFDMVLISPSIAPEKTKGGIILPDSLRKKPDEGIVLKIGPGVKNIQPGAKVVFGKYVGIDLVLEGWEKELVLIHETDILGQIKENGR